MRRLKDNIELIELIKLIRLIKLIGLLATILKNSFNPSTIINNISI